MFLVFTFGFSTPEQSFSAIISRYNSGQAVGDLEATKSSFSGRGANWGDLDLTIKRGDRHDRLSRHFLGPMDQEKWLPHKPRRSSQEWREDKES